MLMSNMSEALEVGFIKEGQYFYTADENHTIIYQRQADGTGVPVLATLGTPNVSESIYAKSGAKKAKLRRLVLFCEMRDCVRRILDAQQSVSDADIEDMDSPPWADDQETLLELYDLFSESFGPVNKLQVKVSHFRYDGEPTISRLRPNLRDFREDPDMPLISALEIYNDETGEVELSNIFAERVLAPNYEPKELGASVEALKFCLSEKGKIDFDYIGELLNIDPGQALLELSVEQHIFHDPVSDEWQTAEIYLSGDVRKKLKRAQEALQNDGAYQTNIEALEKVIPVDLKPEDIELSLGSPWIPHEYLIQFAKEISGEKTDVSIEYILYNHFWSLKGKPADQVRAYTEYGIEQSHSLKLLQHCLNNSLITIYKKEDDDRVPDSDATLLAREKQEQIKDRFSSWIWEDPERAEKICSLYNEKFNALVPPSFDGNHLSLPGASPYIKPYSYQLNAAWRNIQQGNTLYAHEVGAGKTFASAIAAMEMKRLGLISKPCFPVPNHLIGQFSRDFLRLYPNAHLLVLDEDQFRDGGQKMKVKARLKKFIDRCGQYKWDAVLIAQSQFDQLTTSPKHRIHMVKDEISEIVEEKSKTDSDIAIAHLDTLLRNKNKKLEEIKEEIQFEDEDTPYFDQSGIDYLFVDEGQHYKNKNFHTRIEGLSVSSSKKADCLAEKLYYLRKHYDPQRCYSIMTGTPVSNAISEIFIMQQYLHPEMLKAYGIHTFDAWAAAFADTVNSVELSPEGGSYRVVNHLARYKNIPELLRIFLMNTDIITTENLNIPKPILKNGQHTIISVPASKELKEFISDLGERAVAVRKREVKISEDNMLKITTDGRKAALDVGLVGIVPANDHIGKLDYVSQEIANRYQAYLSNVYHDSHGEPEEVTGALQMVFCDIGTPKGKSKVDVYAKLKRKLINLGVPTKNIRFIQNYKTPAAREELFEECRTGKVSVLIGTTEQLGTGTNVQKRLITEHHMDAPWRPGDLAQRDGRIERQGNQNVEVEILRYITKGSFDIYMWQLLERKARFIGQIMHGDLSIRSFHDADLRSLSYAEIKAIASEDPILLEKVGVDNEVARLRRLKIAHEREQKRIISELHVFEKRLPILQQKAKKIVETRESISAWPKTSSPLSIPGIDDDAPISEKGKDLKKILRALSNKAIKQRQPLSERIGTIYGFPAYANAEPAVRGLYASPLTITVEDPSSTQIEFWPNELEERTYTRSKQGKKDPVKAEFDERAGVSTIPELETKSLDHLIIHKLLKPYQSLSDIWIETNDNFEVTKQKLARFQSIQGRPFNHEEEFQAVLSRQQEIVAILENNAVSYKYA